MEAQEANRSTATVNKPSANVFTAAVIVGALALSIAEALSWGDRSVNAFFFVGLACLVVLSAVSIALAPRPHQSPYFRGTRPATETREGRSEEVITRTRSGTGGTSPESRLRCPHCGAELEFRA